MSVAGANLGDETAVRAELHALLAERAFTFGDFVLSSGRRSDFYFDGRQVTLHPRGSLLIGTLVLARCRELNVDAIGGLTLGADPIVAAVSTLSAADGGREIGAFIVRKQVKDHGAGRQIEGPALTPGMRVVLVDDTTTTGSSYITAQAALAGSGVEIVEAIAVVDREEGAREALREHGMELHALFGRREFSAPA